MLICTLHREMSSSSKLWFAEKLADETGLRWIDNTDRDFCTRRPYGNFEI
jgi:hypothetical protein